MGIITVIVTIYFAYDRAWENGKRAIKEGALKK